MGYIEYSKVTFPYEDGQQVLIHVSICPYIQTAKNCSRWGKVTPPQGGGQQTCRADHDIQHIMMIPCSLTITLAYLIRIILVFI